MYSIIIKKEKKRKEKVLYDYTILLLHFSTLFVQLLPYDSHPVQSFIINY